MAGELAQAIADAVVRSHRRHVGRGASRAQAFYRHDVVVVVMRDTMTQAEATLAAAGRPEAVVDLRRELQQTMQAGLIEAVELLTSRKVEALMSATSVDPDITTEVFVLDRPVTREPGPDRAEAGPSATGPGS
jgi:uncharacterized protein YbcI